MNMIVSNTAQQSNNAPLQGKKEYGKQSEIKKEACKHTSTKSQNKVKKHSKTKTNKIKAKNF